MNEQFPRISHVWVDQGYTGFGRKWIEEQFHWSVEVVQHTPKPRGEWVPIGDLNDLAHLRFEWRRSHLSGQGSEGLFRVGGLSNAGSLGLPFVVGSAKIMSFCLKVPKTGSIRV
ncbi:hypothetical protein KDW_55950 [Dictyobacter vulcani]|uniref:Transposase IS4-like domain-containing protein n=1 Tax=Dictyobacter vulcani TaxID=2607529 RepID=A0A5J4KV05_9CHLR|nr:hypothetical protein KDW_55950 [Dictyobacter vulcani]